MSELISIIIPTYNRAHYISDTLNSIINQTYTNWECIVVDDGSTDTTSVVMEEYCKKDKRFKYYHRPDNKLKGANACRNYGFELSKGDYINWFDDDDVMHPHKLDVQLKALQESNFKFSVCQTLVFEHDINNILGLRSNQIYSKTIFEDYLSLKVTLMTPSALWKRSFLKTFDYLFDEDLKAAQEWEFYCRILYNTPNYHVTEQPLIYIRQHLESVTYNNKNISREWHYFLARHKVYTNDTVQLNESSKSVLQNFMLKKFKTFVYLRSIKEAIQSFKMFVIKEKKITPLSKLYAVLAILSFNTINKGYYFIKKIKLSK